MNPTPPTHDSASPSLVVSPELAELVDQLSKRVLRGERVDPARVLDEHPEQAEQLRELLPTVLAIAALGGMGLPTGAGVAGEALGSLGDFRLLREVGRGGMGVVYEAEQLSLGRRVALKVLPFAAMLDERQLARFKHEAQAAALLKHPGIVNVHCVGVERGVHFYAMELIEGQSLAEVIADLRPVGSSGPPLPPGEGRGEGPVGPDTVAAAADSTVREPLGPRHFRRVAELGIQAAQALEYAHQRGVIHRDVKPSNLLVDAAGRLWVADFGLAQIAGGHELTMTGDLVGTLRYMSPEQARGERLLDQRTDVYSLGATLFELLTGQPAFAAADRQQLLRQILETEPHFPRQLEPRIPVDLETIVLKCLSKAPGDRYPTAQALADDLERFVEQRPIHARPLGRLARAWRWCRRTPAMAGLGAAVVALSLSFGVLASVLALRERGHRYEADASAKEARWQQYLSDMHLGVQAWERGDVPQVTEAVERQRPKAGVPDLRGFEWRYLWMQLRSTEPLLTLAHQGAVNSVAYSPDGSLLATGAGHGGDNAIRLWNSQTGDLVQVLRGHDYRVDWLRFSPDGRRLVSVSTDLRIWDVAAGKKLHVMDDRDLGYAPSFTADGAEVVVGSSGGLLKIWDMATGRPKGALEGHTYEAWPAALLSDGTLLSLSLDGTVRQWDPIARKELRAPWKWPMDGWGSFAGIPRDGRSVWLAQRDGSLRAFDLNTGQLQATFVSRGAGVICFTRSLDDAIIATGLTSGEIELWDAATGRCVGRLRSHAHGIFALAFNPDGTRLASASRDGTVKVWDVTRPPATEERQAHIGFALSVAVDRSSRWAASGGADAKVQLWDLATGERWKTLEGHSGWTSVAFSPTEDLLATGGKDGAVRLWDLPSGSLRATLHGYAGNWTELSFSPDGALLATSGCQPAARVFDVRSQRSIKELPHLQKLKVEVVAFSPDGQLLALGDQDGGVQLLSTRNWTERRRVQAEGAVHSLAFSPDSRLLAVGTMKPTASVWDIASGRQVLAIQHGGQVKSMVFTPDGQSLATASDDFRVRVWDLATGAERAVFHGHSNWVAGLALSPDGCTLVSCSDDGYVRFWRAANPSDVERAERPGGGAGSP